MTADLNADVGEAFGIYSLGHDPAVMPHITSANVACGFHAGDAHVMRRTVQLARVHGVAVGAHPGLPDLAGFGRRDMSLTPREIEDIVVYQLGALAAVAAANGCQVVHVKPHGALYNMAAEDRLIADAIARAVVSVSRHLVLIGLSGSALIRAGGDAGLRTASEVFADRAYASNGRLLPRHVAGAVIEDAQRAGARALAMVQERAVTAADGTRIPLDVDTICIHGDTPGAPELARTVREVLVAGGVTVSALCTAP